MPTVKTRPYMQLMESFLAVPFERLIFGAIGVSLALIAWLIGSRAVKGRLTRRLQHVEQVQDFDAVPKNLGVRNVGSQAREAARKNIHSRYSIITKMLAGVLVLLAGFATIFPFLDDVPRALASFLLGVGLAIVGIAARPFVENVISGIVISFSNQLRIGDTVLFDGEQYGKVEDINLTHTVVKLWDWRRYIVPNSQMIQKEFLNYSHREHDLWANIEFRVDPDADLDLVEKLAKQAGTASEHIVGGEEPQFWVKDMGEESLVCGLAAWSTSPENAWYLRADMRRGLSRGLRQAGIRTHQQRIGWNESVPVRRSTAMSA